MNAGKSTALLQAAFNYTERGMNPYCLTARLDKRSGVGKIKSRVGLESPADTFEPADDLFERLRRLCGERKIDCVFVDESQFLTKEQVWQLARTVDDLKVPIMCYGLRTDFQGNAFPGSAALLALADEMREVRTICACGKKASMVVRQDQHGNAMLHGAQVQIGGEEQYVSLCRRHWREKMDAAAAVDAGAACLQVATRMDDDPMRSSPMPASRPIDGAELSPE
jgi:thymidine kinase